MTTTTTTTSLANKNFGSVPGSKSNQTHAGCPNTLQVVSANSPLIQGNYVITNQTRRGQPVWHNIQKD